MYVFGTIVEVKMWGVDEDTSGRAIADLQGMFQQMHRDWHAWEPGPLTRMNAALAEGQTIQADPALLPLIVEANRLSTLSNGLFNPVIGRLLALWGFQGTPLPEGTLPEPAAIEAWLAQAPDVDDIMLDGDRLASRNPLAAYDLGGFAKGYAIDRCIEHLRRRGRLDAQRGPGSLRHVAQTAPGRSDHGHQHQSDDEPPNPHCGPTLKRCTEPGKNKMAA